jgi:hypothetical protein
MSSASSGQSSSSARQCLWPLISSPPRLNPSPLRKASAFYKYPNASALFSLCIPSISSTGRRGIPRRRLQVPTERHANSGDFSSPWRPRLAPLPFPRTRASPWPPFPIQSCSKPSPRYSPEARRRTLVSSHLLLWQQDANDVGDHNIETPTSLWTSSSSPLPRKPIGALLTSTPWPQSHRSSSLEP